MADFTNKLKPEIEYQGLITSVTRNHNEWILGVTLKEDTDAVYPLRLPIVEERLGKTRNVLSATKVKASDVYAVGSAGGKLELVVQMTKLKNREIGVMLEDGEYETEGRSVIACVFPVEEVQVNVECTKCKDEVGVYMDTDPKTVVCYGCDEEEDEEN